VASFKRFGWKILALVCSTLGISRDFSMAEIEEHFTHLLYCWIHCEHYYVQLEILWRINDSDADLLCGQRLLQKETSRVDSSVILARDFECFKIRKIFFNAHERA
jgi:hypothetical protein